MFYDKIFIIKPLTSRPANSEKYLLCTGFKGKEVNLRIVNLLTNLVKNYNEQTLRQTMSQINFESHILQNLISFNLHYSIRQVFYIQRTINYINQFSSKLSNQDSSEMNSIMNDHIRKSQKWCYKYNIAIQNNQNI